MKKVINYLLLSAIMVTFLPYSALAETTNVGVKITGETSIEVVTTISTDITLDLTTGNTTPTYMEIQNNSLVPVSAKITNISTTSEGAPSTFVGVDDKDWMNLSKTETKKYVNFNILGEGQDISAQDILPNTEIDLGTLKAAVIGYGADAPIGVLEDDTKVIEINGEYYTAYCKFYEINANFGRNWDSGDKNFTYQIETVYSQADKYVENEYSMPTSMTGVENIDINFVTYESTNETTNFALTLESSKLTDEMTTQFTNKRFFITVNEISANQEYIVSESNPIECIGADVGPTSPNALYGYVIEFSIPVLESSQSGTTHYLKITVEPLDNSNQSEARFTFIKKVIVYSE